MIRRRFALNFTVLCATLLLSSPNISAELLWSRSNPDWTPKIVSIGLDGTQVFGPVEFGQDHVSLMSGFSPNPATPVWTNNLVMAGTNMEVASAESTDTHVALTQVVQNGNNSNRITEIRKYRSTSSAPDWTYAFQGVSSGLGKVAITPTGEKIVAALVYPMELRLAVRVFAANSSSPINAFNITNFGIHLKSLIISDDGSLAYLTSNSMLYIYDLTNNSIVRQQVLTGMYDAHAFCGNGRAFAFGEFNRVTLYERASDGTWSNSWTGQFPGSWVADRLALSADCSTLVYALHKYDDNLTIKVGALDLVSGQVTMTDQCTGTGSYQHVVSDVRVSADGSRFAVGTWGDQGDLCSELRVYNSDANQPIYEHNYTGSVYGIDMSARGDRVAVAWKPVHANTFSGGGGFDLHRPDPDEQLQVIGIPSPGATVTVKLSHMAANSATKLLSSHDILETPIDLGAIGQLFLPRQDLTAINFNSTNSLGEAVGTLTLPGGAPGAELFIQGLTIVPRTLTGNYVRLKTLP